jgi:DNA anti-recombination protein RmuC
MENIGYVNAASGALQAKASLSQAGASWAQANVARTNASVNQQNANTRRYEAETGRLSQKETQRNNLRQNTIDRAKLRNETRSTTSKIKTESSQRFSNYVNSITGGYRNIQSGNSSLINSLTNMISSGGKALGGLLK